MTYREAKTSIYNQEQEQQEQEQETLLSIWMEKCLSTAHSFLHSLNNNKSVSQFANKNHNIHSKNLSATIHSNNYPLVAKTNKFCNFQLNKMAHYSTTKKTDRWQMFYALQYN